MKKTFTTAYNRSVSSVKDVNTAKFTAPSKVKASLAYATDINKIYEDYVREGKLPLNGKEPIYDENFIQYDSLIEAQKICAEAGDYFNGLPAKIKQQYGNDLRKFVLALNNKDEFLVKEGLLNLPSNDIKESEQVVDKTLPETPAPVDSNTVTAD